MAGRSKALVTGIGGFTGLHLARHLTARGWEVVGLGNAPQPDDWMSLNAGLDEKDRIAGFIAEQRPSHILHLAALSHVVGEPLPFYEVNVLGTEALLTACARAEVPIERVIVASSANIYGAGAAHAIAEEQPPAPANHYAVSKAAMELLVRQWRDRMDIVITRPFNYTGPGQSENFLFPKLVGAFARRDPALRLGNLAVARDLSGIDFVVAAYEALLTRGRSGETYNLCSGTAISISEALALLEEMTGHRPEVTVDPALVRPNEIPLLLGDPGKFQRDAGPLQPMPVRAIFEAMLSACEGVAA